MKAINEAAALHFAAGAIKADDVPVGRHDLSRVQVVITFPDGAAIERGAGSEGDGREACAPPEVISLAAALLFIERSGLNGPTAYALMRSCIVEASEKDLKPKDVMPAWALGALRDVQADMQTDCKPTKKTPATRVGIAGAEVSIVRLSVQGFNAQKRTGAGGTRRVVAKR